MSEPSETPSTVLCPSTSFTILSLNFFLGGLQCAPGALQQRMAAELMYLDSIEESIRQLSDVERIRGVSLAQQEALTLAHVLKVTMSFITESE